MSRPPLRDVAALAGVSEPTVSRVLNGKAGVAASTRDRVVAALRELGFTDVPDAGSDTRRAVIGVIAGEFSNPVFPTLVDHLARNLARAGYLCTVAMADPGLNTEERCIAEFRATGVDGIIFLGGRHAEREGDLSTYQRLLDDDVPFVLVNGRRTELEVPHVFCDEGLGAQKAVEHLVSLGHERVGCVLGSRQYVPTERIMLGYRAAMGRAGLEVSEEGLVHTAFTFEGGRAGAKRLLERGYTALFTSNDLMALGAISAATSAGMSVPDELSVVGYDGTSLTALTAPPLTTLRQPFEDMTRLATDAIVSELSGVPRFRDHYVFEPELLSRGSSGRAVGLVPA